MKEKKYFNFFQTFQPFSTEFKEVDLFFFWNRVRLELVSIIFKIFELNTCIFGAQSKKSYIFESELYKLTWFFKTLKLEQFEIYL